MEILGLIWNLAQNNIGVKNLFEWLTEAFIKSWPDIPWLSVDEGILRLRETTMPKWVHCEEPNPPQWKGPEDMPLTKSYKMQNGGRGISAFEEFCCHPFFGTRPSGWRYCCSTGQIKCNEFN